MINHKQRYKIIILEYACEKHSLFIVQSELIFQPSDVLIKDQRENIYFIFIDYEEIRSLINNDANTPEVFFYICIHSKYLF